MSMKFARHGENFLLWNREQISSYFTGKGLDVEPYQTKGSVLDMTVEAARKFATRGFHDFSTLDIAMFIGQDEWGQSEPHSRYLIANVYKAVAAYYRQTGGIEAAEDMGMPVMHLLRAQTGSHHPRCNLHQLMGYELEDGKFVKTGDRVYSGMKASPADWQEGVSVPFPGDLDYDTAKLLGYYWAIGSLNSSGNKKHYGVISLCGEERMRGAITEAAGLAKRVHNVDFRPVESHCGDNGIKVRGRNIAMKGLTVCKSSMAIATYLTSYHGFPPKGRNGNKKRAPKAHLPSMRWTLESFPGFLDGLRVRSRNPEEGLLHGEGGYGEELLERLDNFGVGGRIRYYDFNPNYWTLEVGEGHVKNFRRLSHLQRHQ